MCFFYGGDVSSHNPDAAVRIRPPLLGGGWMPLYLAGGCQTPVKSRCSPLDRDLGGNGEDTGPRTKPPSS